MLSRFVPSVYYLLAISITIGGLTILCDEPSIYIITKDGQGSTYDKFVYEIPALYQFDSCYTGRGLILSLKVEKSLKCHP